MFNQYLPLKATGQLFIVNNLEGRERREALRRADPSVLIPLFIDPLELKMVFQIGFLIFLPFLVIDLVVSSTPMAMGTTTLLPVFISLLFKIRLFVLVGRNLVTCRRGELSHVRTFVVSLIVE